MKRNRMIWPALLLLMAWSAPARSQDQTPIDYDTLNIGVRSHLSLLRDLSCIYEGSVTPVGSKEFRNQYQALLRFRNDNSFYVDSYTYRRRTDGHVVLGRSYFSLLNGKLREGGGIPRPGKTEMDMTEESQAEPFQLDAPGSPFRFLPHYILIRAGKLTPQNSRIAGSRVLAGHKHVVVDVTTIGPFDPNGLYASIWFDQTDGYFPRRTEIHLLNQMIIRTDIERTVSITDADGILVKLPSSALTQVYRDENGVHDSPTYTETYHLVADSVKVNTGLGEYGLDGSGLPATPHPESR